jgi:hypothetical protein
LNGPSNRSARRDATVSWRREYSADSLVLEISIGSCSGGWDLSDDEREYGGRGSDSNSVDRPMQFVSGDATRGNTDQRSCPRGDDCGGGERLGLDVEARYRRDHLGQQRVDLFERRTAGEDASHE